MKTYLKQQGFMLVSTVMIIIMLMVLMSASMVNLQGNQQINTSLSQRRIQAWFSAYSGMQWAVNDALYHNANHLNCGSVAPTFTLTGGGTRGFMVTINCLATPVLEGDNNYTVYALEATAFWGTINRNDYVTRTIQRTVKILK
jgi:hypothetical protein